MKAIIILTYIILYANILCLAQTFTKITTSPVNEGFEAIGSTWGDYDNDGDLDLYVNVFASSINNIHGYNYLFQNNCNGDFTRIAALPEGILKDIGTWASTSSWIDYDNDGDLDLFVPNAFGNPDNFLYINNGNSNHWISIECIGVTSNTSAIGTRIYAKANINGNPVWQMREINSNPGTAQGGVGPFAMHLGLGDATIIDSLKIVWPASGITQIFTNVNVDRFIEIFEDDNTIYPVKPCKSDLPTKDAGFITGKVYDDVDSNCVFNPTIDFYLSNRMIEAKPGPYFVYSDNEGNYEFRNPADSYTVKQAKISNDIFRQNDCPSTDSVYSVIIAAGDTAADYNFFNILINRVCDVDVNIVVAPGDTAPCPGYTHTICVTFDNNGNAITNPVFTIEIDPLTIPVPGSATSTGDCNCTPVISGNTITCTNQAFPANKICTICFDVAVPLPPTVTTETVLTTVASITGNCMGNPYESTDISEDIADCAFDPNDKLAVRPEGCGPYSNIPKEEELVYRVRFQNTGTAPAAHVIIRDALDSDLDITTLRILGASHPLTRIEIIPDNALILSFEDINLPDSLSDPEGSKGFVVFGIMPKVDLPNGTEITNQAGIYFDWLDVVLTNTTLNTIRDHPYPVADFEAKHSCTSTGLVYDFTYTGETSDDASFVWDFGPDATPNTSTDENPAGIEFANLGTMPVSLIITRFGCVSAITKDIEIDDVSCGKNKVWICHIPPGNPENAHTICVNINSLTAHLAHGNCIGPCPSPKSYSEIIDEDISISDNSSLNAYPNPCINKTTIELIVPEDDIIKFQIFDYMGRSVETLFYQAVTGRQFYKAEFNTRDLSKGIYFGVLHTSTSTKTIKIVVIK